MATSGCVLCGAPTGLFKHGGAKRRCARHSTSGGFHRKKRTTEQHRKFNRRYIEKHPEKVRAIWAAAGRTSKPKRAALILAASDGTLTTEAVVALFAAAADCPYCSMMMRSRDKSLDHKIPLSRGGLHGISNVTICCKRCNTSKGVKLLSEWRPDLAA